MLAGLASAGPATAAPGDTTLLSHDTGPDRTTTGDRTSEDPSISADGRYVAFYSGSNNLDGGYDDVGTEVYLADSMTGTITLVSHTFGDPTTGADEESYDPWISADGNFVVFVSYATDLVEDQVDDNDDVDVFLWSRATNTSTLVSHRAGFPKTAADSYSDDAVVSGDGQYVAFTSSATNLVTGQVDPVRTSERGQDDVFRFSTADGGIDLVSHAVGSPTTAGNHISYSPTISADGSGVAFESWATNLNTGSHPDRVHTDPADVFVNVGGDVSLLSHVDGDPGTAGNEASFLPEISDNGSVVAFNSDATDLVMGTDENENTDVFLADVATGGVRLLSHTPFDRMETADGASYIGNDDHVAEQTLSASLGFTVVAFTSDATNLAETVLNNRELSQAYLSAYALTPFGEIQVVVPVSTIGDFFNFEYGNGDSFNVRVSPGGDTVVFESDADDLASNDSNEATDIFVFVLDLGKGIVSHASGSLTTTADDESENPFLSADGSRVAYQSFATNLVAGQTDTNDRHDVFLTEPSFIPSTEEVTVTAPSPTKVVGAPIPTLTPSYTGLTDGDTAPDTPATCTTTATATSPPGMYPVTCSGAADDKYTFDYVDGILTVTAATPTISTQASPNNLLGAPVRDVATLAGGYLPTGNVTFKLFSNSSCTTQVFTVTASLSGLSATSGWYVPGAVGTYYWTAVYNGDTNNNSVTSPCGAPNESVTIAPFAPPPLTRPPITGNFLGPLTVGSGESVEITGAQVVGPVTVQPGGALTIVNSKISKGLVVNNPTFLSVCGTDISGPSPGQALGVSNAAVPIRIGDPATACAGNRFAGTVNLTANLATTFGANQVSHATTITNGGPGNTVIKANVLFGTLSCTGNSPVPINDGQPNTGPGAKTGQCAGL